MSQRSATVDPVGLAATVMGSVAPPTVRGVTDGAVSRGDPEQRTGLGPDQEGGAIGRERGVHHLRRRLNQTGRPRLEVPQLDLVARREDCHLGAGRAHVDFADRADRSVPLLPSLPSAMRDGSRVPTVEPVAGFTRSIAVPDPDGDEVLRRVETEDAVSGALEALVPLHAPRGGVVGDETSTAGGPEDLRRSRVVRSRRVAAGGTDGRKGETNR